MTDRGDEAQISFRPVGLGDLDQIRRWIAAPHIATWWGPGDETIADLRALLEGAPGASTSLSPWLMEVDGGEIGYIQWYRVADDDPETWYPGVEVPPGTVGVDLAIGDEQHVGRGLGRRLLLEFVHHVIRPSAPEAAEVWIDPDPANERAVRAYRAVGFADTGIDLPDPEKPEGVRRLMRLRFAGPPFR